MKKLLVLICLAVPFTAIGQNYRKLFFAFDVGVPSGSSGSIGSISMEPGYRINDRLTTSIRIEQNGLFTLTGGANFSLPSMGFSGQYYLFKSNRLFVGGGIAIYNPSNNFIFSNTNAVNERNRLGFFPRVGCEFGHFRVMLEYNFVGNMTEYAVGYRGAPAPAGQTESINKNYLNLKLGFFIGGGRKK